MHAQAKLDFTISHCELTLDPADIGNYRPGANLPFLSKVIERGWWQDNSHISWRMRIVWFPINLSFNLVMAQNSLGHHSGRPEEEN